MSNKGFKPGDLVVCINDVYKTRYISEGNIYKISNIDVYQFIYLEEAEGIRFNKSRFKLYEKPEETPKPQFKVDDLVEYIGDSDIVIGLHKGAVYKIYNLCFGGYVRLYEFMHGPTFELKKFKPHKSHKELNKITFKPGDLVECCGAEGVVEHVYENVTYKVQVSFKDENNKIAISHFTEDGRLFHFHKTPSLFLVSRPKKKVTKTVEKWLNIYSKCVGLAYDSQLEADTWATGSRIACVKLTGTYEVEMEKED